MLFSLVNFVKTKKGLDNNNYNNKINRVVHAPSNLL